MARPRLTVAEASRLLAAGYMELHEKAGAFSCGSCVRNVGGFCALECIQSPIDPEHGCCNYFKPARSPRFGRAQEC